MDRPHRRTYNQNANSTRQFLQTSSPSLSKRNTNMHNKTRQPNPKHKIPNNNEKNKTDTQNHGQRRQQYMQEGTSPRSVNMCRGRLAHLMQRVV